MGYNYPKDLTGFKKGLISVISFAYYSKEDGARTRKSYWKCKCICGKEIIVQRNKIIVNRGNISCGCWIADNPGSNLKNSIKEIRQNKIDLILNLSHWENNCLIWDGYSAKGKYPTIKFLGKNWLLKRLLWFLEYEKPLTRKKVIYNSCKNVKCINIKHLTAEKPHGK